MNKLKINFLKKFSLSNQHPKGSMEALGLTVTDGSFWNRQKRFILKVIHRFSSFFFSEKAPMALANGKININYINIIIMINKNN